MTSKMHVPDLVSTLLDRCPNAHERRLVSLLERSGVRKGLLKRHAASGTSTLPELLLVSSSAHSASRSFSPGQDFSSRSRLPISMRMRGGVVSAREIEYMRLHF